MYLRRSKNKYKNNPMIIDGIRFDSTKEGHRWIELQYLQKAGVISELQRQVPYELQPSFYHNGKKIRPIQYVADFVYNEGNERIVEDVKGVKTQEYKLKKKMMLYIYGIEIHEV